MKKAEFEIMLNGSHWHTKEKDAAKEKGVASEHQEHGKTMHSAEVSGDSNMKKGKKFRLNKAKLIALILALVCAIPLSLFASNAIAGIGTTDEFEVPDFRGMTYDAAELAASEFGLNISMGDSVYNSDYNEDTICSQIPDVGTMVKEGKTVVVNISKGMKEGTVPNIVGKAKDDAIFALEKYGFELGTITVQTSKLPKGIVISQSPGAGEEATPGSYVAFVISDGVAEDQTIMPLLLGMSLETATEELELAGLKIGVVEYEKSEAYPKDQIIWQSYEAEKAITSGAAVDIKISTGDEDPAPTVPSIYVDYEAAQNEVFWITVTISDESGTHNMITRAQRIKADGGETVYLEGVGEGSITVIFDNDVVAEYNVNFNTGAVD